MCTSNRPLYTNRYAFSTAHDALYNVVKCGKCDECLDEKQTEWAIRAAAEYRRTMANHGHVLFPTLTFRENARHYFPFTNTPCFSRDDWQLFAKNLRAHFAPESVRFLCCSEYGKDREYEDDYGRKRQARKCPHHHVLLYFNDPETFNAPEEVPIVNKTATKCEVIERRVLSGLDKVKALIDYYWPHGRVGYSKRGAELEGVDGAKYCTKYVTKDIDQLRDITILHLANYIWNRTLQTRDLTILYDLEPKCNRRNKKGNLTKSALEERAFINDMFASMFEDFTNYIGDDIRNAFPFDPDNALHRQLVLNPLRRMQPFHLQSIGFGECLLDETDRHELLHNEGKISYTSQNANIEISAPRYYMRKMFYNIAPDKKTYILNEDGIKFRLQHFPEQVTKAANRWQKYLLNTVFLSRCSETWQDRVDFGDALNLARCLTSSTMNRYDLLRPFANETNSRVTLRDVAIYAKVYANRCLVHSSAKCELARSNYYHRRNELPTFSQALRDYENNLRRCVCPNSEITEPRFAKIAGNDLDHYLYNKQPAFEYFDIVLRFFRHCDHVVQRGVFERRMVLKAQHQKQSHD